MRFSEFPQTSAKAEASQAGEYLAQSTPAQRSEKLPSDSGETVAVENLEQDFSNSKQTIVREFTWLHVGLCLIAALVCLLAYALLVADDRMYVWAVAGDTTRNLSGVIVVFGAWVAWETNRARSHEAEKSDFRDRMRWAVENSDHENEQVSEYAAAVVRSFGAKVQAPWMSEEDKLFIRKAISTSQEHRESRQHLVRSIRLWTEEAEAELEVSIETYGQLSQSSLRKLRVAELKKAAHEAEEPYKAIESYVESLHEIIENHESEHKVTEGHSKQQP